MKKKVLAKSTRDNTSDLLRVEPKPQQGFKVNGEEIANSCWTNCNPQEDTTKLKMTISLTECWDGLNPKQARAFAAWLISEADFVDSMVPARRHNNSLKSKLKKSKALGERR